MTKSMTCIVCPRGCALEVFLDDSAPGDYGRARVEGASCPRGAEYALRELEDPRRTLTSTVRTDSTARRRLPVRSSGPLPLPRLAEAVAGLDGLVAKAPLVCGQPLARNWLGLGVDILAADDLDGGGIHGRS